MAIQTKFMLTIGCLLLTDTNAEPEISNYLFMHISLGLGYGRGMLVMDMNILIDIDMTGSLTYHQTVMD